MKLIAWTLCIGLSCIVSAHAESTAKSEPLGNLRVLSCNVFVGFGSTGGRHDGAVAWIAAQKPDVVALQELCAYTEEKLRQDARRWDHPYVELCKVKSGYHLGLTSRAPIRNAHAVTTEGLWHGILHGQTHGIDFFVLHLAPRPEDIRLPETQIALSEIRKIQSADRPSILLGDFNSPSRLDNDYYQRESAFEAQYNVMDKYLDAGWIDLVHQQQGNLTEAQASMPTRLVENKWGFWRIDYILASPRLARTCISARVVQDPETHHLSDHYPVMAEFSRGLSPVLQKGK